jgi:hypothetical protein
MGRSLSWLPGLWLWLFSDCVPVGHRGEVVAQGGIAPLKVALPALADR